MKIDYDNIKELVACKLVKEKDAPLLESLLNDLFDINTATSDKFGFYIDVQDYHDEYSPENLENHDMYGSYRIYKECSNESITDPENLQGLDNACYILYNVFVN